MAGPRPTERTRRALWERLERGGPDPVSILNDLHSIGDPEGLAVSAGLMRELAHLWLPEHEAETMLLEILGHRLGMARRLGRDPGFPVAALDFLTAQKTVLRDPVILEREEFDRLQRSATTDPLTRLANRRAFRHDLMRELRRARRYRTATSLLIFDVDRFKTINDRYGHMLGDLVLQEVANHLRHGVRETDRVCRHGGEEFAVLAPETSKPAAYRLAERLRHAVRERIEAEALGGVKLDVRLSGGIATAPEDGRDPRTLFERADAALYRAKALGRDRVALHARERRKSVRYPLKAPTGVLLIGGGRRGTARGLDLSADGALVVAPPDWSPDEPVTLHFPRRSRSAPDLDQVGRIVRCERIAPHASLTRYGISFDDPLPSAQLFARVHFSAGRRPGAAR